MCIRDRDLRRDAGLTAGTRDPARAPERHTMRELAVRRLGVVPYDEALALQRALVEQRKQGEIPDTLLLLQHPHVLTLGVKGDGGRGHILASDERLAAMGVAVSPSPLPI